MHTHPGIKSLTLELCEAEETYRAALKYQKRHPGELGRRAVTTCRLRMQNLERRLSNAACSAAVSQNATRLPKMRHATGGRGPELL